MVNAAPCVRSHILDLLLAADLLHVEISRILRRAAHLGRRIHFRAASGVRFPYEIT
jgi:hypothetical protein